MSILFTFSASHILNAIYFIFAGIFFISVLAWNAYDRHFFKPGKITDKCRPTMACQTIIVNGLPIYIYEPKTEVCLGTILFFHANDHHVPKHEILVTWLQEHGYRVVAKERRGYGKAFDAGKPTPKKVIRDAEFFLNWAIKTYEENIHVKGHSIGGHIALRAFINSGIPKAIKSICVEGTFHCCKHVGAERAKTHFKLVGKLPKVIQKPITRFLAFYLISSNFIIKPEEAEAIKTPALIVHAERDRYVPHSAGKKLFELLGSENKQFIPLPFGRHIGNLATEKNRNIYLDFLKQHS